MSKILNFLTEEVFQGSVEWLLGDYLWIIIVGFFFVLFFIVMCQTLQKAAMSQEEWDKKYGNDPKAEKPSRGIVAWCIFLTIASGAYLCYEMNKLNHALPVNIQQSQPTKFFSESYAANLETNKAGRLLLCGYWEGDNGFNLIITTDKIQEIDSHYKTINEYLYNVNSIIESSHDVTLQTELIQGGTSFKADFIFQDMNNMILYNGETKEFISYKANLKPYPRHLDNNLQYVLLYGHMGSGFYMDLSTLRVVEDKTSWTFNIVSANMDKSGQDREIIPMKFSISIYDGKPFLIDKNREIPIDIDNTAGSNMLSRNAFLTSYYYAFGRNYGSRF